jgi:hypothetical protein
MATQSKGSRRGSPKPPPDHQRHVAHAFGRVNAAALRSLYRPQIEEEYGVRAVPVKSALALVTTSLVPDFNRVVNLGVFEPATAAQIDEILELYARAHVPFTVQLSPIARPATVTPWLEQRRLRPSGEWTVLSRDVAPPREENVAFQMARIGRQDAATYARVYEAAFGIPFRQGALAASAIGEPGWHHYLASDEVRAIAAAAMFVHEGTALFAGSGTLASEGGRGAQTALIARRIRDAAALGCDLVLVETGEPIGDEPPPSLRNILRAGFAVAERQPCHVYDQGFRQRLDVAGGRWH